MFKKFDGSARLPRKEQVDILAWLERNWNHAQWLAVGGPTGVGKSAIAASILNAHDNAAIVVPNNNLLEQYRATYPDLNCVRGASGYNCSGGGSCEDRRLAGIKPCEGCPYRAALSAARKGENTIFNPISFLSLHRKAAQSPFKIAVVDEAHLLRGMLNLPLSETYRLSKHKFPDNGSRDDVIGWLDWLAKACESLAKSVHHDAQEKAKHVKDMEKATNLRDLLRQYPDDFICVFEYGTYRNRPERYLRIEPIDTPAWAIRQFFKPFEKVILMSATLPKTEVKTLSGGAPFVTFDCPSPIPASQRPVIVDGAALTARSEPNDVAAWVQAQIGKYPGRNTIVHTTYSMGAALHKLIPGTLYHTPETKGETMAKFKQKGGVWLAAACAEGVDLPGDQCRLNLVPVLPFANVGDPAVKARLAKPGGQYRYALDTVITAIQQIGRSTRSVDDESVAVVGDVRLGRLIGQCKADIPRYFLESVRFS